MLKRQIGYLIVVSFAALLVILLMLDDPTGRHADIEAHQATRAANRPVVLFPNIPAPAAVTGLEVLDVTQGHDILLVRNDTGLWYAPEVPDLNQAEVPAAEINQAVAENAAAAVLLLATQQWFEATPDRLTQFGLAPEPRYRFRFGATNSDGQLIEGRINIGHMNPDNVAYYMYIDSAESSRIFLIDSQIVDLILNMLTGLFQPETTLNPTPLRTPPTPMS